MDKRAALITYVKIILGSLIASLPMPFLLVPNNVVLGGVGGLTVIVHHFTGWPLGVLLFALNAPLFVLAFFFLGRSFIAKAFLGVASSSVFVQLFSMIDFVLTHDPLLIALVSGVFIGIGAGIFISAGGSGGGIDLLARMVMKKFPDRFSLGQVIMCFDFSIVLIGALVFRRLDNTIYALLTIFIIIKLIDLILYGINYAKVAYIISEHGDEIRKLLIDNTTRGITILRGEGGYSGREKSVLICAIKQKQQITELKRIVYSTDPVAFMIIQEAREVFGLGFSDGTE